MLKLSLNEIRGNIQVYPENWINVGTTNCYAYALGLDVNECLIDEFAYNPGTISKNYRLNRFGFFYYSTLVKNLEEDFKALNILYREIEPNDLIQLNEWKVALFVEIYGKDEFDDLVSDFHFLRSNGNGIWFHKNGFFESPTKKDYSNKIITNLDECDLCLYEYRKCYALRLNER